MRNKNETHERIIFSERFACPISGFTIEEIEPRLFSFNAPAGACPKCDGLGTELKFEPDLVVPDRSLSPGGWRHLALGEDRRHLALLRADAQRAGQALQGVDEDAVGEAAAASAGRTAVRLGRRGDRVHLRGRPAPVQDLQAVRGRDRQHRAALARDRQRVGARGAVALPGRASVRCLRRLSPEAAGAGSEDRRQAHRRGRRPVDQRGQHLVRGGPQDLQQAADRDRHAHPQGDPRAAAVPGRCRPRLSDAVARGRHAVGRREPAHPPRLADRLGPDRRAVRARRALDRPASARQRAPAGDAETPARHRQHRAGGRARRGRHPDRRLRGRHRPRRRHPRRRDRRPRHARRDHGQPGEPHRRIPDRHRARSRCPRRAASPTARR